MSPDTLTSERLQTTIAPRLSVRGSEEALDFYQSAFDATVEHFVDGGTGGVVARLVVDGARFWIGEESSERNSSPDTIGGASVRMILTVTDPQKAVDRAVAAGACMVSPLAAEHGWLVARVVDPFGHRWEIGRPLMAAQDEKPARRGGDRRRNPGRTPAEIAEERRRGDRRKKPGWQELLSRILDQN